jgi:hypothetical protein
MEVYETNRKIIVLTLMTMVAFAAVIGGVLMTQAADTETPTEETPNATATADIFDFNCTLPFDAGFGVMHFGRHGGPMGMNEFDGFGRMGAGIGNIEVSEEFTTTVTDIAKNDSDVQNLINEGYNITAIIPNYKTVLDGNGDVTTKATTAIVILQNGTVGHATVIVDLSQSKVTYIETVTRTIIDKS